MAKQIMTRARLTRIAPFRCASNASWRHVTGPVFVMPFVGGKFSLDYCTKGIGATMAILDSDDDATIQRAIDEWIDRTNIDMARASERRAAELQTYGNTTEADRLLAEAAYIRREAGNLRAARVAS
jgi:hypothetical protein